MNDQSRTYPVLDKKTVSLMIKQLFDGNLEDINDDLSYISAIDFYSEIIKEKEKRSYNEKIVLSCNYLVDKSEIILNKLEEARKQLNGSQFDELWECFDISLDFSVWGSNIWEPRILPNGAVLIRNIQKVIGINEQVSNKFDIRCSDIKKDLQEINGLINSKKILHDEDTLSFSIIHRNENGFIWTKNIPESLSEVGQSLIIISKDLIHKLKNSGKISFNNVFINDKVLEVAAKSASEHCILRTFRNSSFIYGTYRLSDDFDTILESYAYRLGEDPISNEYIQKEVSTEFSFIKKNIKKIVQTESPDIYNTEVLHKYRVLKVLLMDKLSEDYTSKKAWQIDSLKPMFGKYWDRPASYYEENSQFWNVAQLNKGYMFLANFSFSFLSSSIRVLEEFKQSVDQIVSQTDTKLKVLAYLPIKELNYVNEDDVFEYGSKECIERMALVMKELAKKPIQTITDEELAKYESEEIATKEFLAMSGSEYKYSILFITPTAPSIEDCHHLGISLSKYIDSSLTIHIPNYGFNQGYSSGNLDAGNLMQYLSL